MYCSKIKMPPRPRVASTCYLCMILLTFVIVFAVDNGAAKRGCALYGHSCLGGHGKRSFQAPVQLIREWPNTNEDTEYDDEDVNKNFQTKISSPHYATFWQKWIQLYERNMNHPSNNNV